MRGISQQYARRNQLHLRSSWLQRNSTWNEQSHTQIPPQKPISQMTQVLNAKYLMHKLAKRQKFPE